VLVIDIDPSDSYSAVGQMNVVQFAKVEAGQGRAWIVVFVGIEGFEDRGIIGQSRDEARDFSLGVWVDHRTRITAEIVEHAVDRSFALRRQARP